MFLCVADEFLISVRTENGKRTHTHRNFQNEFSNSGVMIESNQIESNRIKSKRGIVPEAK